VSTDSKKTASGISARRASLSILSSVLRERRALDLAISDAFSSATLDERDVGFARAIASETLRRFGALEALIRKFVPKAPLPHKAGPTWEILLAGACELLFLKTAPHAAVDAANRLAQEDPKAVHFKPLINAVLRRVTREGEAVLKTLDNERLALPDWMWERITTNYGEETVRDIAKTHLMPPPLDLAWKAKDEGNSSSLGGEWISPRCLRLVGAGKIEELTGYEAGDWWVQDFAAGLPAQLLGDVQGQKVIDLCAAPGGKTAQLAASGADVTAVDASKERLDILRANLARLNLRAELIEADVRDWRPGAPAPFVLLDAPCTATGTMRRHPELPWIKSAADIIAQSALQNELLDAAADMTCEGGRLVYTVCSLEPEEGAEQIEAFLGRREDFVRDPIQPSEVPDALFVSPEGDLRTLPHYWKERGGMDGFYSARLRRCASKLI
jgi:16S rRNA (cytosine967-C5)-methyltransferase